MIAAPASTPTGAPSGPVWPKSVLPKTAIPE
jgi:hypothetical protein